ncbi:MAG: hypothetical protein M1837_000086 [Sclerophora amabilis]|nr:MAG: hypothetical protein M1837_000086 [Sclerophora amabilis]
MKETLSTPPEKGTQEVYDTFWGTYEWPFKFYHRYALCAGLEFTADETRSMTTAFSELSRVKELGLSMDNGLGWLCGPDVSERTKILKTKPYVFGRSRSIPDVKEKEQQDAWRQVLKKRKDDQRKERTKKELEMRAIYRNMRAGFNSSPLISPATNTVTATAVPTNPAVTTGATSASSMTPLMDLASSGESSDDVLMVDPEEYSSSDDSLTHESALMYAGHEDKSKWEQFNSLSNPAFIPNNLTEAQKEWLLETEWAQRAFLASYTLAIIDNRQIFQAVHSLNIARLSSRHISVLERKDFWATLPNLNTLSLFVIPDWREISKHGTSFISTVPIEPSSAVSRVHGILEQYISPLASVKTLRIGWVGGGESAPGYFARNRHILSAPIVPLSFDLLDVSKPFPLLALPHVENLTLSNCWVSPRALIAFVRNLKYKGLRTLKLDSVSLTALPRLGLVNVPQEAANPPPQPGPGVPVVGNNFIAGAWNIPVEGADHPPVDPLKEQFRAGSWIEVIEALTPGITLARLKWDNGLTTRLPRRNNYNLQLIELSSCGYVRIGLQWNQASVDPPHHTRLPASAMSKRRTDLAPLMMTTNDSMLGTIVDYIRPLEMKTLRVIWGMQSGWAEDRKKYEPCEDGWPVGGTGRFTGSVQRDSGGGA